ncbi:sdr family [Fusarium sp. NRRL 52700]|nr:sdr family [Fusarium sp. NRRL 52700]
MSFSYGSVYGQKSANTAKAGTWDKAVPINPVQDRINNELCEYKTISIRPDYSSFSLEEHRLEDYKHGKGRNALQTVNPNAQSHFAPDSKLLVKKTLVENGKMQLLQGSGVEIQVGTKTPKSFKTWCLPIKLVSYYSPYLKEACSSNLQESNKRIQLHDYPHGVFGLFVEWMYYGSYEPSSSVLIENADAKCWVLGDKLRCVEFQNYAMRRLHEQHTRPIFGRPMSCDDVQYVWNKTSPGSKLRDFYMHFIVEHFGSPAKLLGSSTDWDKLLQTQPEIRILLLDKFRKSVFSPIRVESIDEYMEPNKLPSIFASQEKSEPIQLATGAKTVKAPVFNFGGKPSERKSSPPQREPLQLASRTKNYEGAALKFGWKLDEITDNPPTTAIKALQPKQDCPSKLNVGAVLGHVSQCITSIDKSDNVNKSSEIGKEKEPHKGEVEYLGVRLSPHGRYGPGPDISDDGPTIDAVTAYRLYKIDSNYANLLQWIRQQFYQLQKTLHPWSSNAKRSQGLSLPALKQVRIFKMARGYRDIWIAGSRKPLTH